MATGNVVQCNACGGIYRTHQLDGTEYYHACPLQRVIGTKPAPTPTDPNATTPVFEAVANRRDENVKVTDDQGTVAIKAEGLGVTPVTDPAILAAFTAA